VNLRDPWWSLDETRALLQDADWVKLNRNELALLADADGRDAALWSRRRPSSRNIGSPGWSSRSGGEGAFAVGGDEEPIRVAPAQALAGGTRSARATPSPPS
jgi:fructokinase